MIRKIKAQLSNPETWIHLWRPLQWRHDGCNGVSNHQRLDCLLNRFLRRGSKKTPKTRVTGLCAGNSPVTGEFPAQKASNAEYVSIWWRHHGYSIPVELIAQLRVFREIWSLSLSPFRHQASTRELLRIYYQHLFWSWNRLFWGIGMCSLNVSWSKEHTSFWSARTSCSVLTPWQVKYVAAI